MGTSTGSAPAKKTRNRPENKKTDDDSLEKIRHRLFEPKRINKEYKLDEGIVENVNDYIKFLAEKFGEQPPDNKVIEVLIDEGMKNNPAFQLWRKTLPQRDTNVMKNTSVSEDDNLLQT